MRKGKLSIGPTAVWGMIAVILSVMSTSTSAQETILYNFSGGTDGSTALSTLISDASGNLYGTTEFGGASTFGTVFELSPQAGGGAVCGGRRQARDAPLRRQRANDAALAWIA